MLQAFNLCSHRGDRLLWNNLNFSLSSHQCMRINGANGAGKSTLLRIISGLSQATSGEISWNGAILKFDKEEYFSKLIYLGHTPPLKGDMTAFENIKFWCQLGCQQAKDSEITEVLEKWQLSSKKHLPVRSMSQGQKQRVALVRLQLGMDFPLWILDEPWNSLDKEAILNLNHLIEQHSSQGGITLFTSHQDVSLNITNHPVFDLHL